MEYETQEKLEISELFKRAETLKAKFANSEAAIQFYSRRLEEISNIQQCSIAKLIERAEEDNTSEIFLEAISLSRKIQILKKI